MKSGVGRNSEAPLAPGSTAPAPCSSNHSRTSASNTSLAASSSAGTHLPTSVVERKSSTAHPHLSPAIARALEAASRRRTTPERVTIFTDAQAAIGRMASDAPGPGQQYALQARKHIATLRRARPGIVIEIRWCPAHKGVAGNEKADEWAKIAAEEPDTRGVEWLSYLDRTEVRAMPLPRSLANLKREISKKKWLEARQSAGGRTCKRKYKMPESQRPDSTVAGSTK